MALMTFQQRPHWRKLRKLRNLIGTLMVGAVFYGTLLLAPADAFAGPRSGGSFGGRMFRNSGGSGSHMPRTGYNRGYGGVSRPSFFFLPSFGWGWGGAGYGGGFGIGSLLLLGVLGVAAFSVVRAVRQRQTGQGQWGSVDGSDDDDYPAAMMDRAYVYRMQVALGRSARGIQERLARFAAEGDTSTETGLASMLQQTALELMREKHSIRAASVDASGPMALTNAETRLTGLALTERSRFQVERVRGADGHLRRSEAAAEEGKEALEFVIVTVVVATRTPLGDWKEIADHTDLDGYLTRLGGVSPTGLLGLEVVWTPADPNDSLTQTDLMTTYRSLRSL